MEPIGVFPEQLLDVHLVGIVVLTLGRLVAQRVRHVDSGGSSMLGVEVVGIEVSSLVAGPGRDVESRSCQCRIKVEADPGRKIN